MRNISGIKKGVILLSGGIDSVTTLYQAKNKGYQLNALIFDYNQRHKKEINCAKKIARINKIKYHPVKIDLSWVRSSLTDRGIGVPDNRNLHISQIPVTYVAARNIIFLSYAFSLAESTGAKSIFIGAHIQDYSGYPDCRPEFLSDFERAVNRGLKDKGIRIAAPLIRKSKLDIIRLGLKLGVPFKDTWSCYQGQEYPCMRCDSCRFRVKAFRELKLIDPLLGKKRGG